MDGKLLYSLEKNIFNQFPTGATGSVGSQGAQGSVGPTGPNGNPVTVSSGNTNFFSVGTSGSNATILPGPYLNQDVSTNGNVSFNSALLGSLLVGPVGGAIINGGAAINGITLYNNNQSRNSFITTSATATRNVNLPDKAGTVAFISDVPTNTSFVDLSSTQNISGTKTFQAIKFTGLVPNNTNTNVVTYNPSNQNLELATNILDTTIQSITGAKTFTDSITISPSPPLASALGSLILADGGVATTATTLQANQGSNITVLLPASAGTLALTSQVPTNSYVDLTTNQTVAGVIIAQLLVLKIFSLLQHSMLMVCN